KRCFALASQYALHASIAFSISVLFGPPCLASLLHSSSGFQSPHTLHPLTMCCTRRSADCFGAVASAASHAAQSVGGASTAGFGGPCGLVSLMPASAPGVGMSCQMSFLGLPW